MNKILSATILFLSVSFLAAAPSSGGKGPTGDEQKLRADKDMVYVCACLKTKSCACMTEARTEGPCACGTQGGPPLKPVPHDSAWAQANRDALAK